VNYQVVIRGRALAQLQHLESYIAAESDPARAARYIATITKFCRGLATFPNGRGRDCSHISPGLRFCGFGKKVTVVFRVISQSGIVSVHGIYYGGQNWETDRALLDELQQEN